MNVSNRPTVRLFVRLKRENSSRTSKRIEQRKETQDKIIEIEGHCVTKDTSCIVNINNLQSTIQKLSIKRDLNVIDAY